MVAKEKKLLDHTVANYVKLKNVDLKVFTLTRYNKNLRYKTTFCLHYRNLKINNPQEIVNTYESSIEFPTLYTN